MITYSSKGLAHALSIYRKMSIENPIYTQAPLRMITHIRDLDIDSCIYAYGNTLYTIYAERTYTSNNIYDYIRIYTTLEC